MSKKFERTIKVKLTPNELAEIVKDYLEKEGFEVDANGVDFISTSEIKGFGMSEHQEIIFKSCEVRCKLKTERSNQ